MAKKKTVKVTKKQVKELPATSHELEVENDMMIAQREVDLNRPTQAWERGKAIKCAKNESE